MEIDNIKFGEVPFVDIVFSTFSPLSHNILQYVAIGGSIGNKTNKPNPKDIDVVVCRLPGSVEITNTRLVDEVYEVVADACRKSPYNIFMEVRTGPFSGEYLISVSSIMIKQPKRFLVTNDGMKPTK